MESGVKVNGPLQLYEYAVRVAVPVQSYRDSDSLRVGQRVQPCLS